MSRVCTRTRTRKVRIELLQTPSHCIHRVTMVRVAARIFSHFRAKHRIPEQLYHSVSDCTRFRYNGKGSTVFNRFFRHCDAFPQYARYTSEHRLDRGNTKTFRKRWEYENIGTCKRIG